MKELEKKLRNRRMIYDDIPSTRRYGFPFPTKEHISVVDGKYIVQKSRGDYGFYNLKTKEPCGRIRKLVISEISKVGRKYVVADYNGKIFYNFKTGRPEREFSENTAGIVNEVEGQPLVRAEFREDTFLDFNTGRLARVWKKKGGLSSFINEVENRYIVLGNYERTFYDFFTRKPVVSFPEPVEPRILEIEDQLLVKVKYRGRFYDFHTGELVFDLRWSPKKISMVDGQPLHMVTEGSFLGNTAKSIFKRLNFKKRKKIVQITGITLRNLEKIIKEVEK
ncbi:hypothetical protein ACFLZB_00535 [Nanoarchaeota archaeon]